VFLHSVGAAGHVVHCRASRTRNVDTSFFLLGWDQYGFHEKRIGTPYAELVFLHPVVSAGHEVHYGVSGRVTSMHSFSCSGGNGTDSTKTGRDTLCLTCVFAISGICGLRIIHSKA
jgi:hypothetical protein